MTAAEPSLGGRGRQRRNPPPDTRRVPLQADPVGHEWRAIPADVPGGHSCVRRLQGADRSEAGGPRSIEVHVHRVRRRPDG